MAHMKQQMEQHKRATMGHKAHHQRAHEEGPSTIRCGVITISDTRTPDTDSSGAYIRTALIAHGHTITSYTIVPDDPPTIIATVQRCVADGCHAIVTNGGTGISYRDSTFEAIDSLLEKRLTGFGELFRMLSYAEIGPSAMLSRATAGIYQGAFICCVPGSTGAVRLALEKLLLPVLPHLIWELLRQQP